MLFKHSTLLGVNHTKTKSDKNIKIFPGLPSLSIIFILWVLILIPHSAISSPTPRFIDLNINLDEIIPLVQTKELLLLHQKRQITVKVNKKEKQYDAQFVSSMVVINGSVDKIRQAILDFKHYHKFMPQIQYAKVLSTFENTMDVRMKVTIDLSIIKTSMIYDRHFIKEPDGSISWSLIKGDVDTSEGRWEFIPLSDNQTLTIYTSWSDMKSKFFYRMMMKSQPNLEATIPIGAASLAIHLIKKRIEGSVKDSVENVKELPEKPEIPVLTKAHLNAIHKMAKHGTVIFVHPTQFLRSKPDAIDLIFVSGGGIVNAPIDQVKMLTTNFSRYDEFNNQVKKMKITNKDNGFIIDCNMRIGGNFIGVGIDYTLEYTWHGSDKLFYSIVKGDIEHIYGVWEWIPLGPDKTLLVHTSTSKTGKEDSIVLRQNDKIPNSQVVIGASVNLALIENQIPWIEEQAKKLNMKQEVQR